MSRAMKDSGVAWIGEIPEGWSVRKLKYCASFIQEKYNDAYGELQYIGLENVESWSGKYVQTESEYDRSQSIIFQENDILWGKLRPYLAKVYHCHRTGCCSGEFAVIRIDSLYSVRYFWNLLISSGFITVVDSSTYGSKMPRTNIDFIKNVEIPTPPLPEQFRIAAFLDRRCAEIDRVIADTQRTIEEYKKLKQSIITEAVTHGVRGERKMKDSGVEWIGEIPEEWRILNLGAVTTAMRNGYVGPTKDLFVDSGVPYIQSLHIKDGTIDFERHEYYVSEEWATFHPKVRTDDLLIVQTGDIGSVGLVTAQHDGCNCHALIIATPNKKLVMPQYLTYYLRSTVGRELLLYYKTGALLPHLNSGKIKFASVCVPEKNEQAEIADYLDHRCAEIDRLIEAKLQLLTQLEAYKKSVIYEYVTGKREVPVCR